MKKLTMFTALVMAVLLISQGSFADAQLKVAPERIPILMYHHITTDTGMCGPFSITPLKFKEDMLYIKAAGYTTILFKDYLTAKSGGQKLPDNPIIITFDDGYYSNYEFAYPVLKELNMKATIFVIGWSIGRNMNEDNKTPIFPHFTLDNAKEMSDSGLVDIQCHTYDMHHKNMGVLKHPDESQIDYETRLTVDFNKMRVLLSDYLKKDVYVCAYPMGLYSEASERIARQSGYKFTLTTEEGVSDFSCGTYLLKRINMPYRIPSAKLLHKISRYDGRKLNIPFTDIPDQTLRIQKLEALIKEKH